MLVSVLDCGLLSISRLQYRLRPALCKCLEHVVADAARCALGHGVPSVINEELRRGLILYDIRPRITPCRVCSTVTVHDLMLTHTLLVSKHLPRWHERGRSLPLRHLVLTIAHEFEDATVVRHPGDHLLPKCQCHMSHLRSSRSYGKQRAATEQQVTTRPTVLHGMHSRAQAPGRRGWMALPGCMTQACTALS